MAAPLVVSLYSDFPYTYELCWMMLKRYLKAAFPKRRLAKERM